MSKIKKEYTSAKTERFKIKKLFNLKTFNKFLFIIIIISGIYYIAGVNYLTIQGFKLGELKKNVNQLAEENRDIELKTMALESYNNLSSRAKDLNMVAVGQEVDYITKTIELVAKK